MQLILSAAVSRCDSGVQVPISKLKALSMEMHCFFTIVSGQFHGICNSEIIPMSEFRKTLNSFHKVLTLSTKYDEESDIVIAHKYLTSFLLNYSREIGFSEAESTLQLS